VSTAAVRVYVDGVYVALEVDGTRVMLTKLGALALSRGLDRAAKQVGAIGVAELGQVVSKSLLGGPL
jgi:hypothetical protein